MRRWLHSPPAGPASSSFQICPQAWKFSLTSGRPDPVHCGGLVTLFSQVMNLVGNYSFICGCVNGQSFPLTVLEIVSSSTSGGTSTGVHTQICTVGLRMPAVFCSKKPSVLLPINWTFLPTSDFKIEKHETHKQK